MYNIRKATGDDIFWLVKQAHVFLNEYPLEKYALFNMKNMVPLFFQLVTEGGVLMCEKDGTLVGTIGGFAQPHYLNPDLRVFNEVFWWIIEEHRNGKPALLLFNEYVKLGKEKGCQLITLSKLAHSGVKDSFFEKKKFKLLEKSFVLEV